MRRMLLAFLVSIQCWALPTYFCYTQEEYQSLCELCPESCMERGALQKWDEMAETAILKKEIPYHQTARIYTYLYQAQADAAHLSYNVKGQFVGSFDPISSQVLALFLSKIKPEKGDAYSEKLAEIVVAKIKARMAEEEKSKDEFTIPKREKKQNGYGLYMAKWQPWYLCNICSYWPCPPPAKDDPIWKCQIMQIKQAQDPMTECKKESVLYWAGLTGVGSGDWRYIANTYIFCHQIPLGKTLRVRSVLMTGLYDTSIVCFTAKYHYMVMRPKMRDDSIHYEIPVPKHPSYPAGHSIESTAAAVILSHYFPSQCHRWNTYAEQAGWSRIWGGIHYPLDNQAGVMSGRKVAQAVLRATSN